MKAKLFQVRIEEETQLLWKAFADKAEISLSELVRRAVLKYIIDNA